MFNHDERRALTTMTETVKKELTEVETELEVSEEQWKQHLYQYEEMGDDSALSKYEDELRHWKDLQEKEESLKWMQEHFNRCMEELEFLDSLHI